MSIEEDIEFHRGEDVKITDTVIGSNIAGWALTFAMAKQFGGRVLVTKSVGAGITITDGANGVFEVVVDDDDTAGFSPGTYVWTVKRDEAGYEKVLTWGKLTLKPSVAP